MSALRVRLLAHLETCRPDTLFYVGLVGLAGALLSARHPEPWRLIGAWLVPTIGWLASLYGGDYFDRELDAVAKPHRPIPSGRMSARTAFAGMVTAIVAGMALAVALNPRNILVVAVVIVLGVSYSATLKGRGASGNIVRGAPTAFAFVTGMMATNPFPPLALVPIGLVFWLHDSASNLIGALCDTEGDRKGGYQTFPVRYGDAAAIRLLLTFDALWMVPALTLPLLMPALFGLWPYGVLLTAALGLNAVATTMLLIAPNPIPRLNALRSHEFIVFERMVLASAFIAAGSSIGIALIVLAPSAAITFVSRTIMRRRDHPSLNRARRMRPLLRSRTGSDR